MYIKINDGNKNKHINKYISVMVGSAITINSNELEEYEECMIKAKAMIDILENERKVS